MSAMRPQRKNFKNLTLEAISGTDLFLKRDEEVFPGTQKKRKMCAYTFPHRKGGYFSEI
ncbi:hypothetical protein DPMN_166152 [Dreissena polymorpha]|uniref:Uncharacterized protein n=1 Tax=Dreissena polymorpha TaxID=45954 RepID=A0A9D4EYG5_DREPO|nr:hypothetical protein DPMN_166152 [Dreissena polymorpha]